MELVEKVKALLSEVFPPPAKIALEDDDGIIGSVTSERFEGMESADRIHLIWKALNSRLTPQERRRVVIIVAVTPLEEIAHTSTAPDLGASPPSSPRRRAASSRKVREKVRSLLETEFPPPDKVHLQEDEKIVGTVTSRRFEGMKTIDRIQLVKTILAGGLTAEERQHILMIVPATPEEEIAYSA